ncbi:MAG: tetratricopeptide repeat protein [Tannerella sp.]|jgi:tetratricopeptide (TPR) repeat protein|nr:tetratricopeptide repeat protein [Tannerella sp.]
MKHVFLIIGLCLATTAAIAQKAAVTGAERAAKDQKSNLGEARNLIKGAMTNAETKDDPKTWFIAGQVEDAQFNRENTKQILGQQPNEPVMYEALMNAVPFFLKANELDQRPNAKGKVAPKYTKNIKGILSANHIYFLNGGGYYFDEKDYSKAHNFFEKYLEIANLPFFAGEKTAAKDSTYMMIQFYSAIAACQMQNPELAIKVLTRAKDFPFRQSDVYQQLIVEYDQIKDSVNMEKTLEEGYKIFPDSSMYLLNLINLYIYSDRNEKAIELLNTAISKDAKSPELFQALGSVYETGYKDNKKAEEYFKKALDLSPDSPIALSNLGRVYYNQGIGKINDANALTDAAAYEAEKNVAKAFFKQALPFFEKAHQLDPKSFDCMMALRGIYYQLLPEMTKQYEEMEAKMNLGPQ